MGPAHRKVPACKHTGTATSYQDNRSVVSIACLPMSSWTTSGSGVYMGLLACLMYCVEWKYLNASPARKSRGCINPATGRTYTDTQAQAMERRRQGACRSDTMQTKLGAACDTSDSRAVRAQTYAYSVRASCNTCLPATKPCACFHGRPIMHTAVAYLPACCLLESI